MEQLPLAGIIFALLFFLYALFTISRRSAAHRKKLPPESGGAWPVIGHLHLLSTKESTHITLSKLADKHGPIFTIRLGMTKALIVSNWDIAKEFFTTKDRIFASRPKLAASKLLGYDYAMMGLSPYSPLWRHARKIATLELLTRKDEKLVVEMKNLFADITLNIIFMLVIGKRFSTAFNRHDGEDCQKALRDFFKLFGVFVPSDSFQLRW
ncbi:cytochrome P450 82C2-like [Cucurbita maxima]|uniref:Cytochrome P450 82C2-like n=1 Tax=Cucurbita maxima TaxID=3661 RepID=A0A6J1J289_CUCMA|nr:cytochrome P450 82C2-like [Cucurbita maxima]